MPVLTQIGTGGIKNNAVTSAKIGVDVIAAEDIAANAITVAELASNAVSTVKIVDSAVTTAKINDGAVTATKLASGVADLSNDTTPQLGGDLASNGNDIAFADNDKAHFGSSNDLQIYHDGSNSYINETGTGNLYIRATDLRIQNSAGTEFYMTADNNSAVQLYHDNTVRIVTDAEGVTVTGRVLADGLTLGDNEKAQFGASQDLQIYHSGSHSFIHDNGTGSLYIDATNLNFRNGAQTATYADFTNGGAARIMHNSNIKFETTSTGVSVTGTVLSSDGQFGIDSTDYIQFVNNSYIRFITNGSEEFRMEADGDFHADGDVVAYSTTVSDERLKENIQPIADALNKVNQLNGVTFTYKSDGKESAGLIAQDVEKVLPSAVSEKELPLKTDDGIPYKVLQYDQTIGLLVEAVKELTARVKELEGK